MLPQEVNVYQSQRPSYERNNMSTTGNGKGRKIIFYDELSPSALCLSGPMQSFSSKIIRQMFFIMHSISVGEDFHFSISISLLSFHFVLYEGLFSLYLKTFLLGGNRPGSKSFKYN